MRDAWNRINPEEYRVLNERGHVKGRPTFGTIRPDPQKMSGVLVGYCLIHPTINRYYSIKEYQVLGDFPASYKLPPHPRSLSYIARGVSSKVGVWLGSCATLTLTMKVRLDKKHPRRLLHNGLNGYSKREIYNFNDYMGFPNVSLRSKF